MPDESLFLNVPPAQQVLKTPESRYPEVASRLDKHVYDADQLLSQGAPPEWLVEGMIARGNVIILAGPAKKAGKSWLTLHLARCVATGTPFLGRFTRQGYVYYCNVEDGPRRVGYRMQRLGFKPGEWLAFNAITSQDALLALYEALPILGHRQHVALIIIDPFIKLQRAHGITDENASGPLDALLDYYHTIGEALNICFVLVHHFRKAEDMMRGSSAIQGAVDGWWDLIPGKNRNRYLRGWLRDGEDFELGVRYTHGQLPDGSPSTILTPVKADDARPEGTGRKSTKSTMSAASRQAPRSDAELYRDIEQFLHEQNGEPATQTTIQAKIGSSPRRVKRILESMVSDCKVTEHESGFILAVDPAV